LRVVFVPSSVQKVVRKVPLTVRLHVPAWQLPFEMQDVPSGKLPASTQTAVPLAHEVVPAWHAEVAVHAWPSVQDGCPPPPPPHAAITTDNNAMAVTDIGTRFPPAITAPE
jgi:hypothetical protein